MVKCVPRRPKRLITGYKRQAVAFLAGPEAGYTTGASLTIDGGMSLWPRGIEEEL